MTITVSADYDITPARLWELLEPIERHVEWMADAESIDFTSTQRRGVGTRFICVTKIGPIRMRDRMSITVWEPEQRMGVRHEGLVTGSGVFVLEPIDGGTTHPVHVDRGVDPAMVAGRLARRAAGAAPRARLDLAPEPQAAPASCRTIAVTIAPSAITTANGARRHAANAATPTPAARASTTSSVPIENVSFTIEAVSSAAGTRARHRSSRGGTCRPPSTTNPSTLSRRPPPPAGGRAARSCRASPLWGAEPSCRDHAAPRNARAQGDRRGSRPRRRGSGHRSG